MKTTPSPEYSRLGETDLQLTQNSATVFPLGTEQKFQRALLLFPQACSFPLHKEGVHESHMD
jgi:hypothetical protein